MDEPPGARDHRIAAYRPGPVTVSEGAPASPGDRRPGWAIAAALALHLAVCIPLAFGLNVWTDEVYSLATTSGGLRQAIHRALTFELQPPAYFAVLSVWRLADGSPGFARLLSVGCTALTLVVVAHLGRLLGLRHAIWLVVLLAIHPYLVWAAVEIRPYAMIILLSAVLTLAFARAFFGEDRRWRWQLAYGATALALLYTQYYGGLLLTAQSAALLGFQRWRDLKAQVLCLVIAGALFLPLAALVPQQMTQYHAVPAEPGSLTRSIGTIVHFVEVFFVPSITLEEVLPPSRWVRWVHQSIRLTLLASLLAGFWYWAVRSRNDRVAWLFPYAGAVALQFMVLRWMLDPDTVLERHVAVLFLPAVLTGFSTAAALGKPGVLLWLLVTGPSSTEALVRTYVPMAKPPDTFKVTRYIMDHERPGEPILVFPATLSLALRFYYSGPNRIVAVPREPSLERYEPQIDAITSQDDIVEALGRAQAAGGSLWLIFQPIRRSAMGVETGLDTLEAYVQTHYTTESEQTFGRGTRVRHLVARDQARTPG